MLLVTPYIKSTVRFGILAGIAVFALGASSAHGAGLTYEPLVGIPQLEGASANNLADYFNNIYLLTIAIGALIAVVKIMIAGVKYSFSDIVTNKEEAKKDIFGVLLGLAILLVPFIVLNTIYPGLTSLDILKTADVNKVDLKKIEEKPTSAPKGPTSNATLSSDYVTGKEAALKESCEKNTGAVWRPDQTVKCDMSKVGLTGSSQTYARTDFGGFSSPTELRDSWKQKCGGEDKYGWSSDPIARTITYWCKN